MELERIKQLKTKSWSSWLKELPDLYFMDIIYIFKTYMESASEVYKSIFIIYNLANW